LFGKTPLKAQNDYIFQKIGGSWPLWPPPGCAYGNRRDKMALRTTVEFVLAHQHETSCNPETTTKEDFDYLEKVT